MFEISFPVLDFEARVELYESCTSMAEQRKQAGVCFVMIVYSGFLAQCYPRTFHSFNTMSMLDA